MKKLRARAAEGVVEMVWATTAWERGMAVKGQVRRGEMKRQQRASIENGSKALETMDPNKKRLGRRKKAPQLLSLSMERSKDFAMADLFIGLIQ